jgi:hypothetical protein
MSDETDPTPKFSFDYPTDYLRRISDPWDALRMPPCYPAITYDTGPIDRADEPHVVTTDEPGRRA